MGLQPASGLDLCDRQQMFDSAACVAASFIIAVVRSAGIPQSLMSMATQAPRIDLIFNCKIIQLVMVCVSCACVAPALAQRAGVPEVDQAGNFRSSRVQGNRGFYQQVYWLVVDQDPSGLNCRLALSGKPDAVFQYGDIIRADHYEPGDDAISIRNGQAWLRVVSKDTWRIRDLAARGQSDLVRCSVRANSSFIAPINLDDLRDGKW